MRSQRRALSVLRHSADRWLHARRHRHAVAGIPQLVAGSRVVVVCYGNICRSPYAAAVLRRLLEGTGVIVESAGFVGPGRAVPAHALAAALARGEEMGEHRAQLLTEAMVREAQLLVVMDADQRSRLVRRDTEGRALLLLGDLDPQPIEKRAVRDPYAQPLSVFTEVFERIDRCVSVLAMGIRGAATRTAPEAIRRQSNARRLASSGA